MLLDQLIILTELGAEKPLTLWQDSYKKISAGLAGELKSIHGNLEEGTAVGAQLDSLIAHLASNEPDEFALAEDLLGLTSVFAQDPGGDKAAEVGRYLRFSRLFYGRAQTVALYAKERAQLKAKISAEEQHAYDFRLFQNEGMVYCLAFHLALYKAIQDAVDDAGRRQLIDSPEINLGFGGLPGLKKDFEQDEVLTKFVFKILDDSLRERLINVYYQAKAMVSHEESLVVVMEGFKTWLTALMAAFEQVGIDRFSSEFFKPYGDNPLLQDIKL